MADTKISSLAAVTDYQATDEYVLARAGTTKKITAASLAGVGARYISSADDTSTRTLTALSTWEDLGGTTITFTARASKAYIVQCSITWRGASAAWLRNLMRLVVDGATTGVAPVQHRLTQQDTNPSTTFYWNSAFAFAVTGLSAASHTFKLQTHDDGSGIDRSFIDSHVIITEFAT